MASALVNRGVVAPQGTPGSALHQSALRCGSHSAVSSVLLARHGACREHGCGSALRGLWGGLDSPCFRIENEIYSRSTFLRRRKSYSSLPPRTVAVGASSVDFPRDYDELLDQVRSATSAALKDSKMLMEVEFPTAGLDTVPGDAEGGIEMTTSMVMVREFCRVFSPEKAPKTRIFFPDISEVESARKNVFEGTPFKLDYLSRPSGLQDFGFGRKEKMSDHVQSADAIFVAAYPYFNVNEMIAVEELYRESAMATQRPIIVFNGELDRIRSGYYPSFFYPKLGSLAKNFLPKFETVYYIHNFKGRNSGKLFRAYPGPWQVLRKEGQRYKCIHEQLSMPTLKDVALNILSV